MEQHDARAAMRGTGYSIDQNVWRWASTPPLWSASAELLIVCFLGRRDGSRMPSKGYSLSHAASAAETKVSAAGRHRGSLLETEDPVFSLSVPVTGRDFFCHFLDGRLPFNLRAQPGAPAGGFASKLMLSSVPTMRGLSKGQTDAPPQPVSNEAAARPLLPALLR